MPSSQNETVGLVEFFPTLVSHLLPLVGILLFDWRFVELFAVYWIEIAVLFTVYAGAALFAERPIVLDDRDIYLPGVSRSEERDEKWNREPRPVSVFGGCPPIYPRNARLVGLTLVWGFGLLVVLTLPTPGLRTALASESILITAGAMMVSRLYDLGRYFFGRRRYTELSAHQVLEVPGRVLVFVLCYLAVVGLVGGGGLVFLAVVARDVSGYVLPDSVYVVSFGLAVVGGKIAVEWWRFRAENATDPTGFAGWFRPEEPR
jgi:hypothetical protein